MALSRIYPSDAQCDGLMLWRRGLFEEAVYPFLALKMDTSSSIEAVASRDEIA